MANEIGPDDVLPGVPMRERHRVALCQALQWLPTIVEPIGIVVSGSIIRGNPDPASDLDILVLHNEPWRRRVQRWFNGTPVELFYNPEAWLRHSLLSAPTEARPSLTHMLATGEVLLDADGRLDTLQSLARETLNRGTCLSPDALLRDRYRAATQVEDALDFADCDSPDAKQARAFAVSALVQHEYLRKHQFLPRAKERIQLLSQAEPSLATLLARALGEPAAQAVVALRQASLQVLGTAGFFEWDSGPDTAPPPDVSPPGKSSAKW